MQQVTCGLQRPEELEAEATLLKTQASRLVMAENMQILGQATRHRRMTPVAEVPGDAMAVAGPTLVAVTADSDNVIEQYHLVL